MASLPGYRTNVRHGGRVFCVRTEDTGSGRVCTHLLRGDRSVATRTSDGTGADPVSLRRRMQEQHTAVIVALRDGRFDFA